MPIETLHATSLHRATSLHTTSLRLFAALPENGFGTSVRFAETRNTNYRRYL